MARSVEDFIIDFSKEEETGGGGVRVKPDTYRVKIVAAKTGTSEDKGTPYLELTLRFMEGRYAKQKKKMSERLYITPKAYSRFRLLLEALDIKPPAKLNLVKLIPKLKGGELYVQVDDDESREPVRSRVTFQGFINPDDYDPDADENDDVEDEDEDLEEEDEEEDEDEEEEEEEEPPARKRRSRAKAKPARKRSRNVEEEDEDEDEDEEEDEPPARKRRTRAKKAPAKKTRKRKQEDEDEDEEDDLDDLDLDDM